MEEMDPHRVCKINVPRPCMGHNMDQESSGGPSVSGDPFGQVLVATKFATTL